MIFFVPHIGIIVNILSATSNLNVIMRLERDYELFRGGYPDIFWQRQLTSSAKAECEVVSS